MEPRLVAKSNQLLMLDKIIETTHETGLGNDPYSFGDLGDDETVINFEFIADPVFPLSLNKQRTIVWQLATGYGFLGGGGYREGFMKVKEYPFIVNLTEANKLRKKLIAELKAGGFVEVAPNGIKLNTMPSTLVPLFEATQEATQKEKHPVTFGPLQIASDGIVYCNEIPLKLPDRYAILLKFLIKFPEFHKLSELAFQLYPMGDVHKFKTTHITIEKYISAINNVIAKNANGIKIQLVKLDLAESGYQLVQQPTRKRAAK